MVSCSSFIHVHVTVCLRCTLGSVPTCPGGWSTAAAPPLFSLKISQDGVSHSSCPLFELTDAFMLEIIIKKFTSHLTVDSSNTIFTAQK